MNDTDIILFEDKFHIIEIDPDGKKFEKGINYSNI